jgi:hypothetical protein
MLMICYDSAPGENNETDVSRLYETSVVQKAKQHDLALSNAEKCYFTWGKKFVLSRF